MDTVLCVGKLFWYTTSDPKLDVARQRSYQGKPWEQGFKQSCNYGKKGKPANVASKCQFLSLQSYKDPS